MHPHFYVKYLPIFDDYFTQFRLKSKKMNKTYIIIALLGLGAYMLYRKTNTGTTEASASNDTLQPTAPPLAPKSSTTLKASEKRKKPDFATLKKAIESGTKAVSVNSVLN